jgi:hypothetical protein
MKMTTDRDFTKELCYSKYIDMEEGDDTETIYYPSLISIITELCDRIEKLEKRLDQQDEYQQEQNEI